MAIEVKVDSELGKLGINALIRKGFCGPNYDISDVPVRIYDLGDCIQVSHWDMSVLFNGNDKYYKHIYTKMKSLLDNYQEKNNF